MSKRKWYRSRTAVLNTIFALTAAGGVAVMISALVIAFTGPVVQGQVPLVVGLSGSPSPTPTTSSAFSGKIEETRFYAFTKAKDLKAFKQAGLGTVTRVKGRMRIGTYPATRKSVSITVNVAQGSVVSFDDERFGDISYDSSSFQIDGWQQAGGSGHAAGSAKYQRYPLTYGLHTLTWEYFTDNTINLPTDAYYVDNIKITKVYTKEWLAPPAK